MKKTTIVLVFLSIFSYSLNIQAQSLNIEPPTPVEPSYSMDWVAPEDGGVYFMYNVGCDQFLGMGNIWGTHAIVKSITESDPPTYWDGAVDASGDEYRGKGIVVPIRLNKSGNYYTIQHLGTNKRNKYLHSWSYDSWFDQTEGELFTIEPVDDGYTFLPQGQANSYLSVPKVREADQQQVCDVRTDGSAQNSYVVWRLAHTNYDEWVLYAARKPLYDILVVAESLSVDVEDEKEIYLNSTSPSALQSAAIQVQTKINRYKGETWKLTANDNSPIDITHECLTNPEFDNGNVDGWDVVYSGAVDNIGYQASGYSNGAVRIQGFIEAWQKNSDPYVLGNCTLAQTVYGLPEGKYVLEADAISVFQYTDKSVGSNPTKGSYLFMKSKTESRQSLATENYKPEHFIVSFLHDGSDKLTFGVKTVSTTANWIAADNFQLRYYGPANECTFRLKVSSKGEVVYEGTSIRATTKSLTASTNHDIELTLKPDFAYVVSKVLKDSVDITQDVVDGRLIIHGLTENSLVEVQFGQDRAAAYTAYESLRNQPMSQTVLSNLERQKARVDTTESSTVLNSFYTAINNAYACVEAYAHAAEVLKSMKTLVESTNFYSTTSFNIYYGTPQSKYDQRTMTTTEANALHNPYVVTTWDNPDSKVSSFLINCWNTSSDYQVNTWSDDSDFHTPFIEYFADWGASLPQRKLTGTLRNLPEGTYDVGGLVRVRLKDGVSSLPTGITFYANDSEVISVTDGNRIGTSQFYLAEYHVTCKVGEDGILKANFDVASNNNINWLCFKNMKYTRIDEAALNGHPVSEGTYYLYNVGSKQWLCAGGLYGLQASLTSYGGLDIDLYHLANNRYSIHTGYPDYYHDEDEFLNYVSDADIYCNGPEYGWTFTQINQTPYTYIISHERGNLSFDGQTQQLRITSNAGANAQWILVSKADRLSTLTNATYNNPKDATFLISDANFGIDDPRSIAWKGLSDNSHILWDDNGCAEMKNKTFNIYQTIQSVPNGTYGLKAQGVYLSSENNGNPPFFYINNSRRDFIYCKDDDYKKYDFTTAFLYGFYSVGTIGCHVTNNTLDIGARLLSNMGYWCLWDNFQLLYYGLSDVADNITDDTVIMPPTKTQYISMTQNASSTNPVDLTSLAIINPNYGWSTQGWEMDISATNVQYQNANYQKGSCQINGFAEAWNENNQALDDGEIRQVIRNLPKGQYRLEVDAIAVQQGNENKAVTGVYLFAANTTSSTGATKLIRTGDGQPEHFVLTFTKNDNLPLNVGIRTKGADANWVAVDNWKLICTRLDDISQVTITAKSYTREYGESNPVLAYSWEGDEPIGEPTLTCAATALSPVGTYPIVLGNGSLENKSINLVNGTLTVTKAPLTITVNNVTKKQGEKMPEFTVTYSGFKNGETEDVLTKKPTITCSATATSGPGSYQIIVSGAEAENYNITYVKGVLNVEEAVICKASIFCTENGTVTCYDAYADEEKTAKDLESIEVHFNTINGLDLYVQPTIGYQLQRLIVNNIDRTLEVDDEGHIHLDAEIDLNIIVQFALQDEAAFIMDGVSYRNPDPSVNDVVVMGVNKTLEHFTMPTTVDYRGRTFQITKIADGAFANNTNLVSISVPASVKEVGTGLFEGCTMLAAIEWDAPVALTRQIIGNLSNSNLLYYVTDAAYAPTFATNVITNGTAEQIILKDPDDDSSAMSEGFYCPKTFTARKVSYSHYYSMDTNRGVCQGWESLALPFTVDRIVHQTQGDVYPYSCLTEEQFMDGERPFWLYRYTTDGMFEAAGKIEANVPYIISMPNSPDYDLRYLLKGTVTFTAENAEVKASDEVTGVAGKGLLFHPCFQSQLKGEGCYVLNVGRTYNGQPEGSVFVRNLRDVRPFEAYFTVESGAVKGDFFGIFDDGSTGITEIAEMTERYGNFVYDLAGRKIGEQRKVKSEKIKDIRKGRLKAGLYIVNGRKVVVK